MLHSNLLSFGLALSLHAGAFFYSTIENADPLYDTQTSAIAVQVVSLADKSSDIGKSEKQSSKNQEQSLISQQSLQEEVLQGGASQPLEQAEKQVMKVEPKQKNKLDFPIMETNYARENLPNTGEKRIETKENQEKPKEEEVKETKLTQSEANPLPQEILPEGSDKPQQGIAALQGGVKLQEGHAQNQQSGGDEKRIHYGALVASTINKHKIFPAEAKKQRLSGVVSVEFTIDENGKVIQHSIFQSSGSLILDQSVKELMQTITFPKPPTPIFYASIPIRYKLR